MKAPLQTKNRLELSKPDVLIITVIVYFNNWLETRGLVMQEIWFL